MGVLKIKITLHVQYQPVIICSQVTYVFKIETPKYVSFL